MNLLFFTSRDDEKAKEVDAAIREAIPGSKIERYKRVRLLWKRLHQPLDPESIAVLSAYDRKELRKMQILCEWLPEIYVVLIIPDRKEGTIRLAHHLSPRFLSQRSEGVSDLRDVLDKIYRTSH